MHPGSLDFFVGDFLSIFYHSKLSYIIFQGPSGKYFLPGKFDSETPGLDGPDCFCPWVSIQINRFCYKITVFFCDLKTRVGQLEEFSLCWLFSCILKPKNSTFRLGILRYLKYLLKVRCFMKYPFIALCDPLILWGLLKHGLYSIVFHLIDWFYLVASEEDDNQWTDSMKLWHSYFIARAKSPPFFYLGFTYALVCFTGRSPKSWCFRLWCSSVEMPSIHRWCCLVMLGKTWLQQHLHCFGTS